MTSLTAQNIELDSIDLLLCIRHIVPISIENLDFFSLSGLKLILIWDWCISYGNSEILLQSKFDKSSNF